MANIRQQITDELRELRTRQLDEPPEIKLVDAEKTHARINLLLDKLYCQVVERI